MVGQNTTDEVNKQQEDLTAGRWSPATARYLKTQCTDERPPRSASRSHRLTVHDLRDILLRRVDGQIGPDRRLELVVDAREPPNLARPRLGVHAPPVRPLAVRERRRDVDREEVPARPARVQHRVARDVAPFLVRRDGRGDDRGACARELGRNERDALDVFVPVFPGEAQVWAQAAELARHLWGGTDNVTEDMHAPGDSSWRTVSPSSKETLRPPCSLKTV